MAKLGEMLGPKYDNADNENWSAPMSPEEKKSHRRFYKTRTPQRLEEMFGRSLKRQGKQYVPGDTDSILDALLGKESRD